MKLVITDYRSDKEKYRSVFACDPPTLATITENIPTYIYNIKA